MQQCEHQRIFADEWMEREPAINTHETAASSMKRLSVYDPGLGIDLILDAGERGPKLTQKNVQHSTTALRDAKGDIMWQDGCVQHGVTIFLKITELESSTVVLGMFDRSAWELSPFAENAMNDANYDATAAYQTAIDAHEPRPPRSSLPEVDCWRLSKRELISKIRGGASRASLSPILDATAERVGSEAPMLRADLKNRRAHSPLP